MPEKTPGQRCYDAYATFWHRLGERSLLPWHAVSPHVQAAWEAAAAAVLGTPLPTPTQQTLAPDRTPPPAAMQGQASGAVGGLGARQEADGPPRLDHA